MAYRVGVLCPWSRGAWPGSARALVNCAWEFRKLALQLTFECSVLHKRCVQEIIVTATAEKRGPLLGVLYDEIARSSCVFSCGLHVLFVFRFCVGKIGDTTQHNLANALTLACAPGSCRKKLCSLRRVGLRSGRSRQCVLGAPQARL